MASSDEKLVTEKTVKETLTLLENYITALEKSKEQVGFAKRKAVDYELNRAKRNRDYYEKLLE